MKVLFAGLCFGIFFHLNSACQDKVNSTGLEGELVSVVVLYRHGDKTPTTSFPNDPYFDLAYWPMGFGQLTKRGKMRQYELGKWLRMRYSSFLPEEYLASDIYVRSTDVDRTLMSAAVNLAGLYPPTNSQVWNADLPWQPVPVHSIPTSDDQILYMKSKCNRFDDLYTSQYNADFFSNINREYADFYKEVSILTGWDINDVHFFAQLQSVLYVYANHNSSSYLPSWASTLDQEKLEYLAGLNYARQTFTSELKRLRAGPFFDYLISHFNETVANVTTTPKLLMLSGHEGTLAAVLNAMDLFDFKAPAFASCMIWELRQTAGGVPFVNMYYKKNSTMDIPDELQLKSCGLECEYGNFTDILSNVTVNMMTWKNECLG